MAPKLDRLATIFGMVAKLFAKATMATTIAALWLTVVPIDGAAADVQISAARAAALKECSRLAARYPTNELPGRSVPRCAYRKLDSARREAETR